ncbi:unnamed protein product [Penicillium olsonii]|uniref:Zn(2)-C6 fungal-type domain-containing protein n=1 Tax=Penicillium olsonii TaxID=99116 RepID=A0A9W4MQY3_PENOL|nr:unnamed protein product [Penicillium olsonii]CAG8044598.1 unnamed protein product [Penicillium olsonii]
MRPTCPLTQGVVSGIRRVKCGEERPSCLRCTSTGRKCDFYTEPTVFVNPSLSPNTVSRERRAFAYYFEFASSSIGGGLDFDFWRTVVPQVCRHEPAVWDAIISIGALFECSQKGPNLFLRHANPKDLDQNHQDVLAWYARSVSAIRRRIESGSVDAFVGLISCMLFICVEALQGDAGGALQLFAQGVHLILALRPQIASGAISAAKAELLDDTIIPIFLRLAAGALAISGLPVAVLLENQAPELVFDSLKSARKAIASLAVEVPMFETKCIDHLQGNAVLPDEFLVQRNILASKLGGWYNAFVAMANVCKIASKEEIGAAALLSSYHEMLYVMLGTCTSLCLTNFDAFMPNFQRIVEQSAIALRTSVRPDGTQPPFTFEISVGLPLWFTSLRCRDPQTRRLALTLLHRAPPVQGFYQCSMGMAIGERIMDLEESCGMEIGAPPSIKTLEPEDESSGLELIGSYTAVDIKPDHDSAVLIPEEARIGPISLFRPRDGLPKGTRLEDLAEWNHGPDQVYLRFTRNERDLADGSWRMTYKYVPFDHALPDLYYVVSCVDSTDQPRAMVA